MTIQNEGLIQITRKQFKLLIDNAQSTIYVDPSTDINTFEKLVDSVITPGLTEIPGQVAFTPGDFVYQVFEDDTQTEGTPAITSITDPEGNINWEVRIHPIDLNILKSVFNDASTTLIDYNSSPPVTIKQYFVHLITAFNSAITQLMQEQMASHLSDDLTAPEAFNVILEYAVSIYP